MSIPVNSPLPFDPAMTINEIVAQYPETIPVFNQFGLDVCCGGGVTVVDAANRDDVAIDPLVTALRDALGVSANTL